MFDGGTIKRWYNLGVVFCWIESHRLWLLGDRGSSEVHCMLRCSMMWTSGKKLPGIGLLKSQKTSFKWSDGYKQVSNISRQLWSNMKMTPNEEQITRNKHGWNQHLNWLKLPKQKHWTCTRKVEFPPSNSFSWKYYNHL